MGLIDKFLRVSTAQDVAATAVSTDSIPLAVARDLGPGEQLFCQITVGEDAAAAGAATVNFEVIMADDDALTTNVIVLAQTGPISKDNLKAVSATNPKGTTILIPVPPLNAGQFTGTGAGQNQSPIGFNNSKDTLGVRYTVATGPLTGNGGLFTADFIVRYPQGGHHHYASGFQIA